MEFFWEYGADRFGKLLEASLTGLPPETINFIDEAARGLIEGATQRVLLLEGTVWYPEEEKERLARFWLVPNESAEKTYISNPRGATGLLYAVNSPREGYALNDAYDLANGDIPPGIELVGDTMRLWPRNAGHSQQYIGIRLFSSQEEGNEAATHFFDGRAVLVVKFHVPFMEHETSSYWKSTPLLQRYMGELEYVIEETDDEWEPPRFDTDTPEPEPRLYAKINDELEPLSGSFETRRIFSRLRREYNRLDENTVWLLSSQGWILALYYDNRGGVRWPLAQRIENLKEEELWHLFREIKQDDFPEKYEFLWQGQVYLRPLQFVTEIQVGEKKTLPLLDLCYGGIIDEKVRCFASLTLEDGLWHLKAASELSEAEKEVIERVKRAQIGIK